MAKYHINPQTGDPGVCKAIAGGCPFGGEEEHYTSKEAARAAYETHFVETQEKEADLNKPLPNLSDLYKKSPRGNIGLKKQYGMLNGIQADLNAGYIEPAQARSRISLLVKDLEARKDQDENDPNYPTAASIKRAEFIEDLKKISSGATPSETLNKKPEWAAVIESLSSTIWGDTPSKGERYAITSLVNNLNGEPYIYYGTSEKRALYLARDLKNQYANSRKPEYVNIYNKLDEALKKDGRLDRLG